MRPFDSILFVWFIGCFLSVVQSRISDGKKFYLKKVFKIKKHGASKHITFCDTSNLHCAITKSFHYRTRSAQTGRAKKPKNPAGKAPTNYLPASTNVASNITDKNKPPRDYYSSFNNRTDGNTPHSHTLLKKIARMRVLKINFTFDPSNRSF